MVEASRVGKAEKSVENNLLTCKWYTGLSDGPLVKKWLFWFSAFGEAVTVGLVVSVFFENEYFVSWTDTWNNTNMAKEA